MNTRNKSNLDVRSFIGTSTSSSKHPLELTTFSLTEVIHEVLQSVPQSYLSAKILSAELVVIRSDRTLISSALLECFNELCGVYDLKSRQGLLGLKIYGKPSMGILEIECSDMDLAKLSIKTGKSALALTGHAEPDFGFVIAQNKLARVKAQMNIYHNRTGGSKLVFEIPKVRGEAS